MKNWQINQRNSFPAFIVIRDYTGYKDKYAPIIINCAKSFFNANKIWIAEAIYIILLEIKSIHFSKIANCYRMQWLFVGHNPPPLPWQATWWGMVMNITSHWLYGTSADSPDIFSTYQTMRSVFSFRWWDICVACNVEWSFPLQRLDYLAVRDMS